MLSTERYSHRKQNQKKKKKEEESAFQHQVSLY